MRKLSYERSFSEIRLRSTPEENNLVITDITRLQQDFRQKNSGKRDLETLQSESQEVSQAEDDTFSPRKKGILPKTTALKSAGGDTSQSEDALTAKKLFSDDSCASLENLRRPPLFLLDMNIESVETRWTKGSSKQLKRHERTMKAKARKKEKGNKNSKTD